MPRYDAPDAVGRRRAGSGLPERALEGQMTSNARAPAGIVIAGGGLAGLRTVEELRALGYAGDITLIGAENRPPYDRPPLSKQLMMGAVHDTSLRAELGSLGADFRLGERAEQRDDGMVRTDRGEYRFDRLVIAAGARPVALPGPGRQWFLRTIDDALALRETLVPGARLVIIGAGWIGAELATAAAARGSEVTVVEAAAAPLGGAVGTDVGARTAQWYAAAGGWLRAWRAPAVVAANLNGAAQRYDPVPYFWSEQYGRMLQYVGDHRGADRLVWRDPGYGPHWAACWLAGERLVAVLTVGLPRDLQQGRRLIESAVPVDPGRVGDPTVPLRDSAR